MARTNIPITVVGELGTAQPAVTPGDATNDHYIEGNTDVLIEMKNTDAGSQDATIVTAFETAGGVPLEDIAVTVAAGATKLVRLVGGTRTTYYAQSGDSNRIYIDVATDNWEFRVYEI